MQQKKRVEDFQDFVHIVNNCGRALVMSFDDFFEFPKGVSQAKYAQNKPKLEDVQVVKFVRGSNQIIGKTIIVITILSLRGFCKKCMKNL